MFLDPQILTDDELQKWMHLIETRNESLRWLPRSEGPAIKAKVHLFSVGSHPMEDLLVSRG
jgi:hypothetical protein